MAGGTDLASLGQRGFRPDTSCTPVYKKQVQEANARTGSLIMSGQDRNSLRRGQLTPKTGIPVPVFGKIKHCHAIDTMPFSLQRYDPRFAQLRPASPLEYMCNPCPTHAHRVPDRCLSKTYKDDTFMPIDRSCTDTDTTLLPKASAYGIHSFGQLLLFQRLLICTATH